MNEVVAARAGGSVIVTETVVLHPLISEIVQVTVIAGTLVAVWFIPPVGAHEYVYAPSPPVAVAVALPSLPPKQLTGVNVAVAVSTGGSLTVVVAVAVQPFASVTVIV